MGSPDLLTRRLRLPEHVVYRDFGDETVVLNLRSSQYHGLNRTAAMMVVAVDDCPSVADAVARVVRETGQPADVIQQDLLKLCAGLMERGLMEDDESAAQR